MGDISEMRGLIVVASVITIMIAMIIIIPSEIITSNVQNQQTAGIVDPVQGLVWNSTYTANLTYPDTANDFPLNGFNFRIMVVPEVGTQPDSIIILTYAEWWVFEWDAESFHWYDPDNILVSEELSGEQYIALTTVDEYDTPQQFQIQNTKTKVGVTCVYNTTAYDSFEEAVKADDAALVFNVDWDDRSTALNAFQLVGMLFTASLPGLDPLLNYLITIVAWICTIYLAFIFTLRLVGAVFGGGGA